MHNTFQNIQLGAAFYWGGWYCVKRSSRTADMYRDASMKHPQGRHWFSKHDECTSRP